MDGDSFGALKRAPLHRALSRFAKTRLKHASDAPVTRSTNFHASSDYEFSDFDRNAEKFSAKTLFNCLFDYSSFITANQRINKPYVVPDCEVIGYESLTQHPSQKEKPLRCGGRDLRDTRRGVMTIFFITTKLQHFAFVEEPAGKR